MSLVVQWREACHTKVSQAIEGPRWGVYAVMGRRRADVQSLCRHPSCIHLRCGRKRAGGDVGVGLVPALIGNLANLKIQ